MAVEKGRTKSSLAGDSWQQEGWGFWQQQAEKILTTKRYPEKGEESVDPNWRDQSPSANAKG